MTTITPGKPHPQDVSLDVDRGKTIAIAGDLHLNDTAPRSRTDNYIASIFDKLYYLIENSDILILLGDIFDAKTISNQAIARFVPRLREYVANGKKVFYILGNHDLYNYNINTYARSSLSVFEMLDVMVLVRSLKIGPVHFDVIPFDRKFPGIIPTDYFQSVLLGHYYYNDSRDPAYSMFDKDIENCGYKYIFLGHDHEEYASVTVGETVVVRSGSIARNTAHKTNLAREKPKYAEMIVTSAGIISLGLKEVECAKYPEEVFVPDVFNSPVQNDLSFLSNVEDLLEAFKSKLTGVDVSIKDALEEVEAPTVVVSYLKEVHHRNNLDF